MKPLAEAERHLIAGLKRSPNDFDCLPFQHQVAYFVRYLRERGDGAFEIDDIQELFTVADMVSPRSGKPVRPNAARIAKALDNLCRRRPTELQRTPDGYRAP